MKQWHKLLLITFHVVMPALSIYILVNIYSHLSKKRQAIPVVLSGLPVLRLE